MDREQWRPLLEVVKRVARAVGREQRVKRLTYPDWLIVAMFLWAVAHDRTQSWAAERSSYNGVFRPRELPSVSQFNRRVAEPRTAEVLRRVHAELAGPAVTAAALTYLDGKPLTVGVASKDRDAARGHVMGGFAKGYKLHAWMSEDRRIPLWCVAPLNVDERTVAQLLVAEVDELPVGSLALADQNYDTHALHKAVAARGGRLLVKPKGDPSGARHEVTLRQMGEARRELLRVYAEHGSLFRMVYRQRVNAEGIFGNLCGYGGGLTGLPPWVRTLRRVRRWVGGKIILYHARLRARQRRKRAA